MSKLGKKQINLPEGVQVELNAGHSTISLQGPLGKLSLVYSPAVAIKHEENHLTFSLNEPEAKNLWGLTRMLVDNMVVGVTKGFKKQLLIIGVGYGAKVEGKNLVLSLGFSHPVRYPIPEALKVTAEKDVKGNDIVTFESINKELLGKVVAEIRLLKKPEPYKGKGIRYIDEVIKMKAGKTAKK
jgi:large subunit ribosomal protein L6